MPRPAQRLSKAKLDSLRRKAAADPSFNVYTADAGQPGLYAFARRGVVSFVFAYRPPAGGARRRMRIDSYGAITLGQAREIAQYWRGIVASGRDPAEQRTRKTLESITLADAVGSYLEDFRQRAEGGAKRGKRSGYAGARRMLALHVIPKLGDLRARDVTFDQVGEMHRGMSETPAQANRTLAALSAVYGYTDRRGGIIPPKFNPCRYVDRFEETGTRQALTAEDLAALGKALDEAEASGSEHPSALLAIRLIALTGWRRSEVLGHALLERRGKNEELQWGDVDLERGLASLHTKTGLQVRVIGAAVVDLLRAVKPAHTRPRDPVCPGTLPGRPFVGIDKPRLRLYRAAGLEGVDLHSLRHSFASIGAHVQNGRFVGHVGPLLGHGYSKRRGITDRYIHEDPDALRPAADAIAGKIAKLLGLGQAGSVVSIEDGRTIHA